MSIEQNTGCEQRASEELKNAFVDSELAATERRALRSRALADGGLQRDLCELASIKELVREAYEGVGAAPPPRRARPSMGLRAVAFGLLCGLAGWLVHASLDSSPVAGQSLASAANKVFERFTLPAIAGGDRVLLHVSTHEAEDLRASLDAAELLLAEGARRSRPVEVEIVANGAGLDLLRAGVSPMAARIAELQARYPALALVACNQTIERLRQRGERVTLLPGVRVAPTALDEIVSRLQKGWLYVRT